MPPKPNPLTPKRGGRRPAKPGTPIRNGALLLMFAAAVALMVLLLPKEPQGRQATLMVPGQTGQSVEPETLLLRITEVMASNQRAYPDEHGNYGDWVEIQNTGATPVSLRGVGLSDRDDRIKFIFPDMELAAGEHVVVFCDGTTRAEPDAALHARFKIAALGETIYLFDTQALLIDSVQIPPLNADHSYAFTPDGWIVTEMFTPGHPNTPAGYEAFRTLSFSRAEGLVINELVASNRTTLQDEDGELPDWIELYNGTGLPIDLHNYCLSDKPDNLTKWRFPQGAQIQPGEFYLVFASGKDRTGQPGGVPHTNFKLAAEGETVILSDIVHQIIDQVAWENLGKDVSWGRVEGLDDTWQEYRQPTPGLPNNRESEVIMDARMRARNTTGVFISKVVTSSTGLETPYGKTSYDWIELVNLGDSAVDLTGWGLSDKVSRPRKWQFAGTRIDPGQYLLVFASGLTASPTGSGAIHADFRLSALGESLVLADQRGNIVDKLVIPKLERDNAYGRDFERGGLFFYETPTAGGPNATTGFAGYAPAPSVSLAGGIYLKAVTVEMDAPLGVRIRYTTDGSEPTERIGEDYTGPVTIPETAPLRARGFVDGLKPSEIITQTYLINIYPSLPVISLTTDPDHLWNPDYGILAEDEDLKATYTKPPFKGLTYWQKNRFPANFEYFLPDGRQTLNQSVDLQLNGQFSMDQAQKSFRVTARTRYGSNVLAYPFFEDRPFDAYHSVILRNGGQDGRFTRVVDALQAKIIDWTGADIMHMASTPVLAYLNGEYWGQYNLRERMEKYAIAAYEGWSDPEQIDFIKGERHVISGTYANYGQLIDFVRKHDLAKDPQALQTVLDWVDVDNYFDFMIFQIYFGNTDTGNIKFYRQRVPGAKWRWVVFDLDWGYFRYAVDTTRSWLKPEGSGEQRYENVLIRKLLEVPELRDKFLRRYGELYRAYLSDSDRIHAQVDLMVGEIVDELPMHFQRWAGLISPVISDEPTTPEGEYRWWESRVARLHNVLKIRPHYAWQHAKDWFGLSDAQMLDYFGPQPQIPEDALL